MTAKGRIGKPPGPNCPDIGGVQLTIRYLAQELYRLTLKVEELERALTALEEKSAPERGRLEAELLMARKELARLRTVLESKKEKTLI